MTLQGANKNFSLTTCKLFQARGREARENASNQIVIGFSFASDWLRGWCKFFLFVFFLTNHRVH